MRFEIEVGDKLVQLAACIKALSELVPFDVAGEKEEIMQVIGQLMEEVISDGLR